MHRRPLSVHCRAISKDYRADSGSTARALRNIDLDILEGEFLSIVGPSGSGKSTLLRILAGLEAPSSGTVSRNVKGRVGFLFQQDSIFPWRTVEKNLAYSLEARGLPVRERDLQVKELCSAVGLPLEFLKKFPRELSGGEARRVSIGMALSADADLLLLDEPTSQLDYISRLNLQKLIHQIWTRTRPTIVCVTHDIDEAILLSERIVVLGGGELRELVAMSLPFPRDHGALASEAGIDARTRILTCLGLQP